MVTHLPARFHRLVPRCSSNKPRSRGNDLAGRSADPFLPARRSVLSRAMSEERDIFLLRLRSACPPQQWKTLSLAIRDALAGAGEKIGLKVDIYVKTEDKEP